MRLTSVQQHLIAAALTVPTTLAVIVADESSRFPAQFEQMRRPSWNWKAAGLTYGGGIAFDRITTKLATDRGAVEQNRWRQTEAGHWRTDATVLAGSMAADYLLHRIDTRAPRFLRGAAVGIYATRGGINLTVAWK